MVDRKKFLNNHNGLTLVELMVVIAIMMIVVGIMTFSITLITGQEARQCANNISAALDKTKNYCMTKSGTVDAFMEIKYEPDRGYIAEYYVPSKPMDAANSVNVLIEEEVLGRSSVKVSYDGTDVVSHPLKISYNRVNGGFKDKCSIITVERGRTYELKLMSLTGKHTMERIN